MADAALRTAPVPVAATVVQETEKPKESPLSFRIGGTDFTPGGFVDFENVFRTTNTGGSTTTAFGSIPFSNTVQGHLTEFRSTGQYSRYNLKVAGNYGANKVVGYIEGDFNGNDAANVFVSSNPHTNRLRLYWLDLKRGKWEFLGGQTWGLQTPNRVGLSPTPGDVFVPIGEDAQTHVGLPYTRAAEFRAVYHFTDHFQWGVAMQNPDQFVGAGEVIFPFAFNAALGPQLDAANQTTTPNAFPDIHTKFAWDDDVDGKHMHFEAGGFLTNVKITNVPIGGTTFVHHSAIGASFHGAFNFELAKGFRVMANGLWGQGNGRYLIGFGPQAVVVPIATGPGTFDLDVSMVHSGAAIVGSEIQAKKSLFGFYYGGFYYQRNAFQDVTSPLVDQTLHRFWRTQFTQQRKPGHSGSVIRLDADFLEEPTVRRGSAGYANVVRDARSLVRACRRTQECSLDDGICQLEIRAAVTSISKSRSTEAPVKSRRFFGVAACTPALGYPFPYAPFLSGELFFHRCWRRRMTWWRANNSFAA